MDEKLRPRFQFTLPALFICVTLCGVVAAAWLLSRPDTGNAILLTLICAPFVGGLLVATWVGFLAGIVAVLAIGFADHTMPFAMWVTVASLGFGLQMLLSAFFGSLVRRWLSRT